MSYLRNVDGNHETLEHLQNYLNVDSNFECLFHVHHQYLDSWCGIYEMTFALLADIDLVCVLLEMRQNMVDLGIEVVI